MGNKTERLRDVRITREVKRTWPYLSYNRRPELCRGSRPSRQHEAGPTGRARGAALRVQESTPLGQWATFILIDYTS